MNKDVHLSSYELNQIDEDGDQFGNGWLRLRIGDYRFYIEPAPKSTLCAWYVEINLSDIMREAHAVVMKLKKDGLRPSTGATLYMETFEKQEPRFDDEELEHYECEQEMITYAVTIKVDYHPVSTDALPVLP